MSKFYFRVVSHFFFYVTNDLRRRFPYRQGSRARLWHRPRSGDAWGNGAGAASALLTTAKLLGEAFHQFILPRENV